MNPRFAQAAHPRARASRLPWWLWLPGLLGSVWACDGQGCGCGGDGRVAELVSMTERVERDFAASVGQWQPAEQGAGLAMGDGIRTSERAEARLRLLPRGQLLVRPSTTMRFQTQAPEQPASADFDIEMGSVEVDSSEAELSVSTPAGVTRVLRGSRVRIRSDAEGVQVQVLVGRVRVEDDDKPRIVEAGETIQLAVGPVTIEVDAGAPAPAPVPDEVAEAEQGRAADGAGAPVPEPELWLEPKGNAVVHVARLPVTVAVRSEGCEAGARLEFGRHGRRLNIAVEQHEDHGRVSLRAGSYRYQVRCKREDGWARAPVSKGRVRVLRDAATRKLPPSPPPVTVAADGRRYTVRYQNLLPAVTLKWPDAPPGAPYTLRVEGVGKPLRLSGGKPEQRLKAGRLREGEHRFWFETTGKKRSKQGKLRIAFDNTARTAYLSQPPVGGGVDRSKFRVAGAALRRSVVTLDDRRLSLDAQGRFSVEHSLPDVRKALAVRVAHPATGVHYYLRRLGD